MSCDFSCPLSVGVHGEEPDEDIIVSTETIGGCGDIIISKETIGGSGDIIISKDSEEPVGGDGDIIVSKDVFIPFGDEEFVRCWLDAKARYMYIVTPVEHVSALRSLTDKQLAIFFQTAVKLLESEGITSFSNMIFNHGKYMNHAHLHLKINVTGKTFLKNQNNWTPERQQTWSRLLDFNSPKMEKILKKAPPNHNKVFVSHLDHTKIGIDTIKKELGVYGTVINIIPLRNHPSLIVQFAKKEEAAKCICESYGKPIGDILPKMGWSRY